MRSPEEIADRIIHEIFRFDPREYGEPHEAVAQALEEIVWWQYRARLVKLLREEITHDPSRR